MRLAALTIAALDTVLWLAIAAVMFFSSSDAATKGLDHFAGIVVTALYLFGAATAFM